MSSDSELSLVLSDLLDPWLKSLSNPRSAQEETLRTLLNGYGQTEYGKRHGVKEIKTVEEFRSAFPIVGYGELLGEFDNVRAGNFSALLPEPVSRWVMTRGSSGKPKVIPTTETFLSQIFTCGARAIVNFAQRTGDFAVLKSRVLNLNFPSEVYSLTDQRGEVDTTRCYGYSSGTYAKLFPALDNAGLVPLQEEIDSLGGGVTKMDWEKRFDLVYERSKDENVGSAMGVTSVILSFARYVKKKYGVYPRQTWKMKALFLTSVAKIQSKYARILRHYYGEALPVVEMYTATEGVFGQQKDDLPYIVPNYDTYFFEVKKTTTGDVKLLSELKPREWGSLIISSALFPRYEIGDLIESVGQGYFRVFGRNRKRTVLEHVLYDLLTWRWPSHQTR